jgi:hypothetical protein
MKQPDQELECWLCHFKGRPDEDGNCARCRQPLIPVDKDRGEELRFYCVVCEQFFVAPRDESGFDQAACPTCGDLSNTPDFHLNEAVGQRERRSRSWQFLVAIMFGTFLGTTLLFNLFRWLAAWW